MSFMENMKNKTIADPVTTGSELNGHVKYKAKCPAILTFFIICCSVTLFGKVKAPSDPAVPAIKDESAADKKNKLENNYLHINADVSVKGRGVLRGRIVLQKGNFQLKNSIIGVISVPLKKIKKIIIKSWSGYRKKNGAYVFYPEKYNVFMKGGEEIVHQGVLKQFNRFYFDFGGERVTLFSYFYIYKNRKNDIIKDRLNVPMEGTVDAIILSR